ncbi:hypothetical protein [Funiculus sociatus]|uniref:hypothetical protein n=1 Tax=Funiculus sociatus TaxID=450527 RepID=UPI00329852A4
MKARIQPKSGFWDVEFQLPVRLPVDAANLSLTQVWLSWEQLPGRDPPPLRQTWCVRFRSDRAISLNVSSSAEALSEPFRRSAVATL